MTAVLEAREVHVARGRAPVLHGVTLSLAAGEALALVGPNAAGKSTLLRTLAGLLPATRGAVLLDARPLPAWPRDALARALALVTSEDEGPGALAVEDRVALGRYPYRGPFRPLLEEDRAAVRRALERTGIAGRAFAGGQTRWRYPRLSSRRFDVFTGELEDHLHHAYGTWAALTVHTWPTPKRWPASGSSPM